MSESAKLVSRGEQRYCPVTNRVITTLYGLKADGTVGTIDTCVATVEDFVFWLQLNQQTMAQIQRHQAQAYIETLPKGRKRKAPSNVVALKRT